MSPARELRVRLLVSVVLLGGMLGWIIYDQRSWAPGGTPEEVLRHVQRHTRLMRSCIVVFACVVISGMTRWVYWALCRALDPAKYEECAIQQMDTQALLDLSTSRDATYGVDHGQEA